MDTKRLLWCGMASREKAITQNLTADLYPEVLLWIGLALGKSMVQSISMLMSVLVQSIVALKNITPHMSAFNDFTNNIFFAEDKFNSMKECFKFVCLLKRKLLSRN